MVFNAILAMPYIILGSFKPLVTFSGKCSPTVSPPLFPLLPTFSPDIMLKLIKQTLKALPLHYFSS